MDWRCWSSSPWIESFRTGGLRVQQSPAGSDQAAVVGPHWLLADAQATGSRSFPLAEGRRVVELTVEQLHWLLAGIDLAAMRPHPARTYIKVG